MWHVCVCLRVLRVLLSRCLSFGKRMCRAGRVLFERGFLSFGRRVRDSEPALALLRGCAYHVAGMQC